jgi:hypothetical protein
VTCVPYQQTVKSSCVAACIVIAEAWRGRAATEAEWHAGAGPKGLPLRTAAALPGTRFLCASDSRDLIVALGQDRIAIATVSGPAWTAWIEGTHPALQSPHGRLAAPGPLGGPLHSIVLCEHSGGAFRAIDPWFPPAGQPLTIDDDDFERVWAGEAVLFER